MLQFIWVWMNAVVPAQGVRHNQQSTSKQLWPWETLAQVPSHRKHRCLVPTTSFSIPSVYLLIFSTFLLLIGSKGCFFPHHKNFKCIVLFLSDDSALWLNFSGAKCVLLHCNSIGKEHILTHNLAALIQGLEDCTQSVK